MSNQPMNNWDILNQTSIFEHPFMALSTEEVRLPDGTIIKDWPKVHTRDYVNVLIVNEKQEALIVEGYKHGMGRSSWQVIGGYIEDGEDPVTAVKRELLEETGYSCKKWIYLSSYVMDANRHFGVGHFFVAQDVQKVTEPNNDDLEEMQFNWVTLDELKYALIDGRIGAISYATNIALALLLIEQVIGRKKRTSNGLNK